MLIALTGATGFVGRAVLVHCQEAGYRVRALARKASALPEPGPAEIIEGSLQDAAALARLVAGADAVLHVAGRISAPTRRDFFDTNEAGTRAVAEAAAAAGVRRFVHVSSLSARRPELTAYGASKAAGEAVIADFTESFESLVVRPPAVYGPGDRATLPLVKAMTGHPVVLAGSSISRFSLIHVGDLARIIAEAAESDRTGTIEVDDGKEGGYSWADLVKIAGEAEGRDLRPYFLPMGLSLAAAAVAETIGWLTGKPGMVSRDKIRELYAEDWVARPPGWPLASSIRFRTGFSDTLRWYREAGWLPERRRGRMAAEPR